MLYNQSDTFYPVFIESGFATTVTFQILRLSDGFWWDFNNSTFNQTTWTTKAATMTADDQDVWGYTTGWAIPNTNDQYQIFYIEDSSPLTQGERIHVNDALLVGTVTNVHADSDLTATLAEIAQGVPSATPSLRDALMLLYMALRNQTDTDTAGATDYLELYNTAGTVICKKVLTDNGTVYSEAKMITGP